MPESGVLGLSLIFFPWVSEIIEFFSLEVFFQGCIKNKPGLLSNISPQNQTKIFHQWEVDASPVDPSNESVYYLEI